MYILVLKTLRLLAKHVNQFNQYHLSFDVFRVNIFLFILRQLWIPSGIHLFSPYHTITTSGVCSLIELQFSYKGKFIIWNKNGKYLILFLADHCIQMALTFFKGFLLFWSISQNFKENLQTNKGDNHSFYWRPIQHLNFLNVILIEWSSSESPRPTKNSWMFAFCYFVNMGVNYSDIRENLLISHSLAII